MTIKREALEAAASAGMLKYQQIDNLLVFLVQHELKSARQSSGGRFNFALLYYFAGMAAVLLAALAAFVAVNALGIGALLWVAAIYGLGAMIIARRCNGRGLHFVASLFALLAVAAAPTVVFVLQYLQGAWGNGLDALLAREVMVMVDPRWLTLELAALATAACLLLWLRLPVLMVPCALATWLIGMDVVPMLIMRADSIYGGGLNSTVEELRKAFTLLFGLSMVLLGVCMDLARWPRRGSFAFWAYFVGLMGFCAAVPLLLNNQLPGKFAYLAVHVALVLAGAILRRRIFEVFGFVGIALVLGDMAWDALRGSPAFVPMLTLLSMTYLVTVVWWWRSEPGLSAKLRRLLPNDVRAVLATHLA